MYGYDTYESHRLYEQLKGQHYYAEASDRDVHLDVPLSNFASMAFNTEQDMFIGEQLVPSIPVGKQDDKYYIIEKDNFMRRHSSHRAKGNKANRIKWTVSSDSYHAENYALASDIPLEDLRNADTPVALRENSVLQIVHNLRLDQESRIAGLMTTSGNLGTTITVSSKWTAGANGDNPIDSINSAHVAIRNSTGFTGNTLVLDWETWLVIQKHPTLTDFWKHTNAGLLSRDILAELFQVQRILIGQQVENVAPEGQAASVTPIWGNNAILAYVGPSTGRRSATVAGRFQWRDPIYPANFGVLSSRMNAAGSEHVEIVEAGHFQDEKIIAADLGVLIAAPR